MLRESGEFLLTPIFCVTYMTMNKYHRVETFNIHIQSLINIIQKNNWVITTKKVKGKLPLFCGGGERAIPIYGVSLLYCYKTVLSHILLTGFVD